MSQVSNAAWSNWAGNHQATPSLTIRPSSPEQLAVEVSHLAGSGRKVKATGAGHSFTAISAPVDVRVDLSDLRRLLSIDETSGEATVEAGITLLELNRTLAAHGRALQNLGDIQAQTLAGAISTGTHGTGASFGGIAAQVRGLTMVDGQGRLVGCGPSENRDLFEAARVGLGALGVITGVRLQTEPIFALRAEEGALPLAQLLEEWDERSSTADHFESFWFPHTDTVYTKTNTRVGMDQLDPLSPIRTRFEDSFVQNTVFGALVRLQKYRPSLARPLNATAARALGSRSYTDVSFNVFCTERRVRFKEMEYAVDASDGVETLREVVRAIAASDLDIGFPVELRRAAPDDIMLSTAYQRPSMYLAFHIPTWADHTGYFRMVEDIMSSVGGRPHWGKMHTLGHQELAGRYPRFGDFLAQRRRMDPELTFANPELDRILGR